MAAFDKSVLFQAAKKELRDLARREFSRSSVGQIAEQVRVVKRAGSSPVKIIERFAKGQGADAILRQLGGTPLGSIVRSVQRYGKAQASQQVIGEFLDQLGPLGALVKALTGTSGVTRKRQAEELALASNLIRAFGGEAWLPRSLTTAAEWERGIEAARQKLEESGYEVIPRSIDTKHPGAHPTPSGQPAPPKGRSAPRERSTVDVPLASGGTKRLPKTHPIVTGEMVPTPQSSNVYSYGYDLDVWTLYVRFKDDDPNKPGQKRNAPGSLYKYENVEPETFLSMFQASSKGTWIWDRLRVRGTVSGHQYDYALVGISRGYVPRKAVYTPQGEAYQPRTIRTDKGRGLTSSRGFEYVRPGGSPNRGTPNRGRPNTGAT